MDFCNINFSGPEVTRLQWAMVVEEDNHGEEGEVGIIAEARMAIPIGGGSYHLVNIRSGGLWGVDGDEAYHREVYEEEKANLWAELQRLASDITSGALQPEEVQS